MMKSDEQKRKTRRVEKKTIFEISSKSGGYSWPVIEVLQSLISTPQ
jgi:hypothetical protein